MIDLPMMGATGIPSPTSYYPPAPSQSVGGLGGLGGKAVNFLNSGDGSDIIRAVGMSLMSSPGNHWLRDMGTHYSALRGDRRANEKEARSLAEQQQARDALVAFGVQLGISESEMRSLAANETAAKARIQQAVTERDTARTREANNDAFRILAGGDGSASPAYPSQPDPASSSSSPSPSVYPDTSNNDDWNAARERFGWQAPQTGAGAPSAPQATKNDLYRAPPVPAVENDARRAGFNQTQARFLGVMANPNVSKEVKDIAKLEYERIGKLVEPTTEMKNFEHYLGLDPTGREAYREYRQSGSAQVNIAGPEKGYDKTIGEGYGKRFLDMQDEAQVAQRALNALDVMEQSLSQPGFYSGAGGEHIQQLKRMGAALGMDPEGISSIETFNAMSKQAALDAMGGSLGSGFSNADRDFVIEQVPNLGNTPEGNTKLVDIQRRLNRRKQEIAQLARQYADRNGGRINAGFDDFLAQWAEQNPVFPLVERVPAGAVDMLRSDPSLAPQFDAKYGAGSAERILRGR